MKTPSLNHVALHIRDVDRSRDFYERVLRLEAIARPAFDFEGAWFRLGTDQELHLIKRGEVSETPPSRDNHFALLVENIEEWHEHLQREWQEFRAPKQRPDGAIQIFIKDPDGHFLELCTLPPS